MPSEVTVMKFGGTSVEDGPAFERVAHIVGAHEGGRPVVVASAMSRVTDALLSSLRTAARGEITEALRSVEEHLERHLQVGRGLGATARAGVTRRIESFGREIADLLGGVASSRRASAGLRDAVASYGERLSAYLLASVLAEHGLPASHVDARRCIVTDGEHGSAGPLPAQTRQRTRAELGHLLKAGRIPVLGGFIAATSRGVPTTLGRGSSDYTATLVAAALDAREAQIWTDVSGVLTADPRLIETARTVPRLSYGEAAQLARFGAKVLHPKSLQPAARRGIPLRIFNSRAPGEAGTLICAGAEASGGAVKAITHQAGVHMIEVTSTPAAVANGFRRAVQEIFGRRHTAVNLVATSEVGVSLACAGADALPSVVQDLRRVGSVEVRGGRALVCCVGAGLRGAPGAVWKLFDALAEIDPTLTRHSTAGNNCIFVVAEDRVGGVVRRLHRGIFEAGR
ncbi:MAG: aspartate kinase [Acidobacteriota bacterium]|nr:aspartate kinase [Acidobacteriota bacterium]